MGKAAVGGPFPTHFSCFPAPPGDNCTARAVAIGDALRPHRSIYFPDRAEPLSARQRTVGAAAAGGPFQHH